MNKLGAESRVAFPSEVLSEDEFERIMFILVRHLIVNARHVRHRTHIARGETFTADSQLQLSKMKIGM